MRKKTEAKAAMEIRSTGAAEINAGLQITVLDESEWTPEQSMRKLLENCISKNKLKFLHDLAVKIAMIECDLNQRKAAAYLGVSDRVMCYKKKALLGTGPLDERDVHILGGREDD